MTNLSLSLEAGYSVDSPALSKHTTLPTMSFRALLARASNVIFAVQQRRAERVVARILAQNGGLMTDDVERQVSRKLGV